MRIPTDWVLTILILYSVSLLTSLTNGWMAMSLHYLARGSRPQNMEYFQLINIGKGLYRLDIGVSSDGIYLSESILSYFSWLFFYPPLLIPSSAIKYVSANRIEISTPTFTGIDLLVIMRCHFPVESLKEAEDIWATQSKDDGQGFG